MWQDNAAFRGLVHLLVSARARLGRLMKGVVQEGVPTLPNSLRVLRYTDLWKKTRTLSALAQNLGMIITKRKTNLWRCCPGGQETCNSSASWNWATASEWRECAFLRNIHSDAWDLDGTSPKWKLITYLIWWHSSAGSVKIQFAQSIMAEVAIILSFPCPGRWVRLSTYTRLKCRWQVPQEIGFNKRTLNVILEGNPETMHNFTDTASQNTVLFHARNWVLSCECEGSLSVWSKKRARLPQAASGARFRRRSPAWFFCVSLLGACTPSVLEVLTFCQPFEKMGSLRVQPGKYALWGFLLSTPFHVRHTMLHFTLKVK